MTATMLTWKEDLNATYEPMEAHLAIFGLCNFTMLCHMAG